MKAFCIKRGIVTTGLVGCLLAILVAQATASSVVYDGSSGNLSASVTFSLTGNTLTVDLTNTSLSDVTVPADVLTAVFFNSTHLLSPVSAAASGSTAYYGSTSNVGDGWGYYVNLAGGGHGFNNAITAVGFGIGSGHSSFSNHSNSLGGINYGLLSAGDNPLTGNNGVKGKGPLFKDSVQFTFTVGNGFKLSELGDDVVFQYGSSLLEPHYVGKLEPAPVPEPSSLLLVGSGVLGLGTVLRRIMS